MTKHNKPIKESNADGLDAIFQEGLAGMRIGTCLSLLGVIATGISTVYLEKEKLVLMLAISGLMPILGFSIGAQRAVSERLTPNQNAFGLFTHLQNKPEADPSLADKPVCRVLTAYFG